MIMYEFHYVYLHAFNIIKIKYGNILLLCICLLGWRTERRVPPIALSHEPLPNEERKNINILTENI